MEETRGLTFGWQHEIYIYPRFVEDGPEGAGPWRYFWSPLPNRPVCGMISDTLGVNLGLNFNFTGISLGKSQYFVSRVSMSDSSILRLSYSPAHPLNATASFIEPNRP